MTTDKDPSVFRRLDRNRPAEPRWRLGRLGAVALGIVAVGLTLGVAELVAQLGNWFGVFHLTASPFSALGATFIYFTPEWLKEFGIRLFGQNDKVALAVSMTGTFLILGAIIGLVGRRRPRWAVGIAVVLIVITGVAVITRPNSTVADLIPTVIGGLVGVWFLVTGLRVALLDPRTGVAPAASSEARADTSADAAETRDATAGTSKAAASKTAASKNAASKSPGGTAARTAAASGSVDRRHFLRFAGIGALAAAAAGILSRWVPSTADVEASRAAVTLPTVSDSQPPVVSQSSGAGATSSGTASGSAPATTATTGSATGGGSTGSSPGTVSGQGAPVDVNPPVPGITPYVTSAGDFYRVDTAFVVPRVTTDAWKLKIHGLVDNPFEITFADLLALPQIERMVTLTCVSNEVGGPLAGNAAWQGVRVADLLAKAKPQSTADCVYSSSADGFTVTTPLAVLTDGRDAMLAIGMNGAAAASRARLPGPNGGSGTLRLRVGDEVGRRP